MRRPADGTRRIAPGSSQPAELPGPGLWRHVRRHWPLAYEPALWSVVFPLGMYSVATLTYGKTTHIAFMEPIARVMIWVAVVAWVLVAAAFLTRLTRSLRKPAP